MKAKQSKQPQPTKEDIRIAKMILRNWGESDGPITAQGERALREAVKTLHDDRIQHEARQAGPQ